MTSSYLTRFELRELTGTPLRSRQLAWLVVNGWPHAVDVHGRVLVARAYHDKQLGISSDSATTASPLVAPPPLNLSAV